LPPDIVAYDTLSPFYHELNFFWFTQSYPSIVFQFVIAVVLFVVLAVHTDVALIILKCNVMLQRSMTITRVRWTMDFVLTAAPRSTLAVTSVIAVTVTEFHRMTTSLALVSPTSLVV